MHLSIFCHFSQLSNYWSVGRMPAVSIFVKLTLYKYMSPHFWWWIPCCMCDRINYCQRYLHNSSMGQRASLQERLARWKALSQDDNFCISGLKKIKEESCVLFVLRLNFIKIPATKMPRALSPLHWYHAWCKSSTAAGKVFIEEAQKPTHGCVFNTRGHPQSESFWPISVWVRNRMPWVIPVHPQSTRRVHASSPCPMSLLCSVLLKHLRGSHHARQRLPPRPAKELVPHQLSPSSAGSSHLPPVPSPPRCPWGHLQGEKPISRTDRTSQTARYNPTSVGKTRLSKSLNPSLSSLSESYFANSLLTNEVLRWEGDRARCWTMCTHATTPRFLFCWEVPVSGRGTRLSFFLVLFNDFQCYQKMQSHICSWYKSQ